MSSTEISSIYPDESLSSFVDNLLELILEVCTRVILIDEGQVVAEGSTKEVMGNETLMAAHGKEKPHSLGPALMDHDH